MTSKFTSFLVSHKVPNDIIQLLKDKLRNVKPDTPDLYNVIYKIIHPTCDNILPQHVITQVAVYYQEDLIDSVAKSSNASVSSFIEDTTSSIPATNEVSEEEENEDEEEEEESVSDEESSDSTEEMVLLRVVLADEDLNELLVNTKFQNTFTTGSLTIQSRKILDEFPKLNIDDIRDIKIHKDLKSQPYAEESYCLWETLEIANQKRNTYSTVLCNQYGQPANVIIKKGFPGRIGKATVDININDYVLHGEYNRKYFNFYIFRVLNLVYNEEKNLPLAQYKLVYKSYQEYEIKDIDTFPKIWLFDPKTGVMSNTITSSSVQSIRNGFVVSFSNVIQHLLNNLTLNNFKSDNDPNFPMSIFGRTFRPYKPKNVHVQEWLNGTSYGSRIFVYNQLVGPNAMQRGVNCIDIFDNLIHVVFDLWIPEIRDDLLKKYNTYIPIFLDFIVHPSSDVTDLSKCLECPYEYEHSLCSNRENNPFLNVTIAISTPAENIITRSLGESAEKGLMYIPANIQIKRAGNAGMFCEEFHHLSPVLKSQLFPLGSDSWLGLLSSFGDLRRPSPLFSRFKVR
jgi:hypothetical protein